MCQNMVSKCFGEKLKVEQLMGIRSNDSIFSPVLNFAIFGEWDEPGGVWVGLLWGVDWASSQFPSVSSYLVTRSN